MCSAFDPIRSKEQCGQKMVSCHSVSRLLRGAEKAIAHIVVLELVSKALPAGLTLFDVQ
jgi:hypothetical protein